MKKRVMIFSLLMVLAVGVNAQTKKEIKAQKEQARADEVKALIEDKTFVLIPMSATTNKGRNVNLDGSYSLKIDGDSATAYLPFFGRGYAGTTYGGDGAIEFKTSMENFKMEDQKKNAKQISFTARKESERYQVSISISASGYASLTVLPENRSMMSYYGEITEIKPKK